MDELRFDIDIDQLGNRHGLQIRRATAELNGQREGSGGVIVRIENLYKHIERDADSGAGSAAI